MVQLVYSVISMIVMQRKHGRESGDFPQHELHRMLYGKTIDLVGFFITLSNRSRHHQVKSSELYKILAYSPFSPLSCLCSLDCLCLYSRSPIVNKRAPSPYIVQEWVTAYIVVCEGGERALVKFR